MGIADYIRRKLDIIRNNDKPFHRKYHVTKKILGHGKGGNVMKIQDKTDPLKTEYALKKSGINGKQEFILQREASLKSEYIVKMIDCFYNNNRKYFIVME